MDTLRDERRRSHNSRSQSCIARSVRFLVVFVRNLLADPAAQLLSLPLPSLQGARGDLPASNRMVRQSLQRSQWEVSQYDEMREIYCAYPDFISPRNQPIDCIEVM